MAALHYTFRYVMAFSESQTLVYAKQFAFPDYIPNDWYLSQPQLVRIPYQLVALPIISFLPLYHATVVLRLIGYAAVAGGLGAICHRLKMRATTAWIAFGFFLMISQSSMPGREWIVLRTESKVFGYALILFAVHALMRRRLWEVGLAAGLATTMHILVGFWASVALGLVVLVERVGSWRERLIATGAWAAAGSFALYAVFDRITAPKAMLDVDPTDIWVNFRNPHYTLLSHWGFDEPWTVAVFLSFAAILIGARWTAGNSDGQKLAASFGLATLVPLGATILAAYTPLGEKVAFYLPFRVADTMVPLFGSILAGHLLYRFALKEQAAKWVTGVGLILLAGASIDDLQVGLEHRREAPLGAMSGSYSKARSLHELCAFVRERTPPGTLLVTAPDEDLINYACERPVIVTFRNVPSSGEGIAEWYRRLVELNGGEEPRHVGFDAESEITANFQRLPDSDYVRLGEKYGSRYLLLKRATPSDLPRIFDNRHYALYVLGPPETKP